MEISPDYSIVTTHFTDAILDTSCVRYLACFLHVYGEINSNLKQGYETHFTENKFCRLKVTSVGRVAQSVWRLTTGWTGRGSNPGGDEIFRTHTDRPWGPPNLLYNGVKRPGRGSDHPPPPSAEVEKE
jgi:hypothetical protein